MSPKKPIPAPKDVVMETVQSDRAVEAVLSDFLKTPSGIQLLEARDGPSPLSPSEYQAELGKRFEAFLKGMSSPHPKK